MTQKYGNESPRPTDARATRREDRAIRERARPARIDEGPAGEPDASLLHEDAASLTREFLLSELIKNILGNSQKTGSGQGRAREALGSPSPGETADGVPPGPVAPRSAILAAESQSGPGSDEPGRVPVVGEGDGALAPEISSRQEAPTLPPDDNRIAPPPEVSRVAVPQPALRVRENPAPTPAPTPVEVPRVLEQARGLAEFGSPIPDSARSPSQAAELGSPGPAGAAGPSRSEDPRPGPLKAASEPLSARPPDSRSDADPVSSPPSSVTAPLSASSSPSAAFPPGLSPGNASDLDAFVLPVRGPAADRGRGFPGNPVLSVTSGLRVIEPFPFAAPGDEGGGPPYQTASATTSGRPSPSRELASAIDLSRTNDLLQQLLDEVRRGRQPFLPVADRSGGF